MPLTSGDRLGPYEIVAPIGKGGMGEVYRAHDSRLKRDVAIKVSTAQFSERFEREAQAIAALNHSNICQLYDVGPNYLVMEYIEGTPLKGPLPLDQALKYGVQICAALDAAHKKGITHRDLKPANILVTKAGIKLLDFGLAKLGTSGVGQAPKPDDATLTMALTGKNEIVGTLYYMSPEQLQAQGNGQEIDGRSDIFSFGLVLYEMLTGKRAFEGSSPASVIAAIMERPAPSIASIAPPSLDRLLQRCLAKDPDDRWQTARDLKAELEWIANAPSDAAIVTSAPARHRFVPWIAAGAMTAIAALAFWAPWRTVPPLDRPLVRLDVDLGADVSLPDPTPGGSTIAISPDGTRLVYVSGTPTRLFTRRLDQPNAIELLGTQGASRPFFSPDGQWVGFLAGGYNKLNKISVDGGAVVPLADIVNHAGSSWSEDGSIFVSQGNQKAALLRIPSDGGPPQTVAELGGGEGALALPQILPGGNAVLFATGTGLVVDKLAINVLTLADRRRKVLVRGGQSPRYLPSSSGAASRFGHLVYVNKSTLFAVPFDLDRLETRGTAVPVLNDVGYNNPTGVGQFDFSRTGTLVYRRTNGSASATATLQWVYPSDGISGKPNSKNDRLRIKPGIYQSPSLSPDGTRIAMSVIDGGNTDIWVYEPRRDGMTRLTFGGAFYRYPSWSADSQYVVFSSVGQGVFWARADGAGQPQALMTSKTNLNQIPGSFTPDNKRLAYFEGVGRSQIWTVPLEEQSGQLKAGTPEQFFKSNFSDQAPSFSPDGRWLAYQSDESGANEVYVRPFPPRTSEHDRRWPVSNNGGTAPRWSRSGHELIYQSGDQLLSASYTVRGNDFVPGKPRVWVAKLGAAALFSVPGDRNWDLAPDAIRVVVATPMESAEAPKQEHQIVMLLNFFDELRRKVPVGK